MSVGIPLPPPPSSFSDAADSGQQLLDTVAEAAEDAANKAQQGAVEAGNVAEKTTDAAHDALNSLLNIATRLSVATHQALVIEFQSDLVAIREQEQRFVQVVGDKARSLADERRNVAIVIGALATANVVFFVAAAIASLILGTVTIIQNLPLLMRAIGDLAGAVGGTAVKKVFYDAAADYEFWFRHNEWFGSALQEIGYLSSYVISLNDTSRGKTSSQNTPSGRPAKSPSLKYMERTIDTHQRLQLILAQLIPAVQRRLPAGAKSMHTVGALRGLQDKVRITHETLITAKSAARFAELQRVPQLNPALKAPIGRG